MTLLQHVLILIVNNQLYLFKPADKSGRVERLDPSPYLKVMQLIDKKVCITFNKAVSDSIFEMINSFIVYRDKPLVFIGATLREKLVCYHPGSEWRLFWHCIWHDECGLPWHSFDFFIGATFREKLIFHHRAVNINCWIRSSLSRLFLALYLTW